VQRSLNTTNLQHISEKKFYIVTKPQKNNKEQKLKAV